MKKCTEDIKQRIIYQIKEGCSYAQVSRSIGISMYFVRKIALANNILSREVSIMLFNRCLDKEGKNFCSKCHMVKNLVDFSPRNRYSCTSCDREYKRKYMRKYNSSPRAKESMRRYFSSPKGKEYIAKQNLWKNLSDPRVIVGSRLMHRIKRCIKKSISLGKIANILGWDIQDLIQKFSKQGYSLSEMVSSDYHIDHIMPHSSFHYRSLNDPDFRACWSLDNLQLLPREMNLQKSNKIPRGCNKPESMSMEDLDLIYVPSKELLAKKMRSLLGSSFLLPRLRNLSSVQAAIFAMSMLNLSDSYIAALMGTTRQYINQERLNAQSCLGLGR